jgi:hypothetical protein
MFRWPRGPSECRFASLIDFESGTSSSNDDVKVVNCLEWLINNSRSRSGRGSGCYDGDECEWQRQVQVHQLLRDQPHLQTGSRSPWGSSRGNTTRVREILAFGLERVRVAMPVRVVPGPSSIRRSNCKRRGPEFRSSGQGRQIDAQAAQRGRCMRALTQQWVVLLPILKNFVETGQ